MPDSQFHTIDLHFLDTPELIASYVVVGPTSAALIETGPGSTLPGLLQGLRQLGLRPADVRDVLVTHIHLDHAGAAGWWARQGATVYVHAVGAPHLIDPSKLLASASRIYGDQMDALWGEVLSVPAERVRVVDDGAVIEAAGAAFTAVESPGHAQHHHCYRLGDIAFMGDAAGVRLPGFGFQGLPAPPPEFDLQSWQATLRRLAALNLRAVYPTHFGLVSDPADHFRRYGLLLSESAEFVRVRLDEGLSRDAIVDQFTAWNAERASADGLDAAAQERYARVNGLPTSVDGIIRYWVKRKG